MISKRVSVKGCPSLGAGANGQRDAERRLELATGRDAAVIEREVDYYRSMFRTLSAAQTDAATAGLREVEEHRPHGFTEPTTSGSD